MTSPRRHLSMLRSYTAADALTIGNASCGTIAIFLCLDYIADRTTGASCGGVSPAAARARLRRARRLRRAAEPRAAIVLGADLDSLADVISFGVAPAVLGFTLGLRGGWDMLMPHLLRRVRRQPPGAVQRHRRGAVRHATGKVKYFEGTPIPTSILIVAAARPGVVLRADRRRSVVRGRAVGPARCIRWRSCTASAAAR